MKFVLIGSVISSQCALEIMIQKKLNISMVFSLDESCSDNVSTYRPIHKIAEENGIPFTKFKKINDEENLKILREIEPDYIFVIGLSQLVRQELLDCAQKGVIGYHPAPLPKFRGRAAIVWQILLGMKKSAASLFFIDEGTDSGDIICQEEFVINETDYAEDVLESAKDAGLRALSKGIDLLLTPGFAPTPQNHEEATYLLRRAPEDGAIDWSQSGRDIQRFIRAVSRPYPGAFSNYEDKGKVVFWRADFIPTDKYYGFNGQIIENTDEYIDILCKDGKLRVTEYEASNDFKLIAGHRFV